MRLPALVLAFLMMAVSSASPSVITVDVDGGADFTAIAPAVTAAITRDTILIYPGYYEGPDNSSIDFDGKDMVVRTVGGPESTTINGYMFDNVFVIQHGEDITIEGLEVTGAVGLAFVCNAPGNELTVRRCAFNSNYTNGGDPLDSQRTAVGYAQYSTVVFEECGFAGNIAGSIVATMHLRDCDVTIADCSFERNREYGSVFEDDSCVLRLAGSTNALMERCVFVDNRPEDALLLVQGSSSAHIRDCDFLGNSGGSYALLDDGLLHFENSGTNIVEGCTFAANEAASGCISSRFGAGVTITDCTFASNGGSMNNVIAVDDVARGDVELTRCILAFNDCPVPIECEGSLPTITACCFAETGNPGAMCEPHDPDQLVFADPLFCDREGGDYTLCLNSPCLVPNNDWGVQIGAHYWGCDACDSPVETTSWGAIKVMYR